MLSNQILPLTLHPFTDGELYDKLYYTVRNIPDAVKADLQGGCIK